MLNPVFSAAHLRQMGLFQLLSSESYSPRRSTYFFWRGKEGRLLDRLKFSILMFKKVRDTLERQVQSGPKEVSR